MEREPILTTEGKLSSSRKKPWWKRVALVAAGVAVGGAILFSVV